MPPQNQEKETLSVRVGYNLPVAKAGKKIDELALFSLPVRRIKKRWQVFNGKKWVPLHLQESKLFEREGESDVI